MKKVLLPVLFFLTVFTVLSCGGNPVKAGSITDPGYLMQFTYTSASDSSKITSTAYIYHDKLKMVSSDHPGKYTLVIGDRMLDVDEKNGTYNDVTPFLIDREFPVKGLQGYLDLLAKQKAAQSDILKNLSMVYTVSQSTIGGYLSKEYSAIDDKKTGEAKYLHLYFCGLPELKLLMAGLETNTSGLASVLVKQRFLMHPEYGWLLAHSPIDGFPEAWTLDKFGEYPLSDATFSLDGLTETAGGM